MSVSRDVTRVRRAVTLVALSAACAGWTASLSAQGLRGLGKKVTDAVEKKANQKVDEKINEATQKLVDNSFDSVFGDGKTDGSAGSGSGGKSGGSSRVFSMMPNAPTEPYYDFDAVFTYEVDNMSKGKSDGDKALLMMHFNSDGKYTGTKIGSAGSKKGEGDIFAIFDVKNESMVMLLTSDKEKMSMAYSWKDAQRYAAGQTSSPSGTAPSAGTRPSAAESKPITYSSLGKRTILGYSAEGFKGENEDGEMEVWVTKDPRISYWRMAGASSSMKQMRGVMPGSHPDGMLLEVRSRDKKSGDTGRMTITAIDTKAKVHIDMNEYPRLGKSK
ncbi:MAG: DUF4412 domain-containing protein [Gemmatimonadaceae bacterium]|nr:DUF4412 domain-containing protein [Gemmatimonadaceae bacterium]